MKVNLVILTVACLSCLVPPAFSTGILAAKALAAAGAVKGAAILGAGALAAKGALAFKKALLAKGALAAKGLAAAAVKGAALKGAALLATKEAVVKGAALGVAEILGPKVSPVYARKPMLLRPAFAPPKPCLPLVPAPLPVFQPPTILEKLSGLVGTAKTAVNVKANIASGLLELLQGKLAPPKPTVVYEIVKTPSFYPVPLINKYYKK